MGCTESHPLDNVLSNAWDDMELKICKQSAKKERRLLMACNKVESKKQIRADHKSYKHNATNDGVWPCCHDKAIDSDGTLYDINVLAKETPKSIVLSDWGKGDLARLEAAVIAVAKSKNTHPPRYRELSTCYYDNQFATDESFHFWRRVALRVHTHNEDQCYLKYNELHGSDVARFVVKGRALAYKTDSQSVHDMDPLSVTTVSTPSLDMRRSQRHKSASF